MTLSPHPAPSLIEASSVTECFSPFPAIPPKLSPRSVLHGLWRLNGPLSCPPSFFKYAKPVLFSHFEDIDLVFPALKVSTPPPTNRSIRGQSSFAPKQTSLFFSLYPLPPSADGVLPTVSSEVSLFFS